MTAPTAITFEELIRDVFLSTSQIMNLLAHGADSYFPRPTVSPDGAQDTPFLVVRFGGKNGSLQSITSCQVFYYDDPRRQYWRLEELVNQTRLRFEGLVLGPTKPGYRRYDGAPVRYEGESGHLTDGGWDKNMMFCRLTAMGL